MNSEAQRARNKRKRDKLREKRRAQKYGTSVYRFRLDGCATHYIHRCGLMPESCADPGLYLCSRYPGRKFGETSDSESHEMTWSTEWVYCGTHDLSSSDLDAIECFCNTWFEMRAVTETITLIVQKNGNERRKVWQGHTIVALDAAKAACLFAKQLSREELEQTPCSRSQSEEGLTAQKLLQELRNFCQNLEESNSTLEEKFSAEIQRLERLVTTPSEHSSE